MQRCRECGKKKDDSAFVEWRGGTRVRLAYCRDCKRSADVAQNRVTKRLKRKGIVR